MNKWHLIKSKGFCTSEETVTQVRRQPTERERGFFANFISNNELISRAYKELKEL